MSIMIFKGILNALLWKKRFLHERDTGWESKLIMIDEGGRYSFLTCGLYSNDGLNMIIQRYNASLERMGQSFLQFLT